MRQLGGGRPETMYLLQDVSAAAALCFTDALLATLWLTSFKGFSAREPQIKELAPDLRQGQGLFAAKIWFESHEDWQKGSHLIVIHAETRVRTVAPVHPGLTLLTSLLTSEERPGMMSMLGRLYSLRARMDYP